MELVKLLLEDVITTGTGAAFTPGQGEQYATPFAFGKGKKKKRMPIIRRRIFEETEYTPEAGKVEYEKLNKALAEATTRVDRFLKAFKGFSVERMLSNKSAVDQLKKLGENIWQNLEDIHDSADELAWAAQEKGDREGYKNYTGITNSCRGLQETLNKVGEVIDSIQKASEKLNLNEGEDFELPNELNSIGSYEDYKEYLKTVFPDSQIKDIVYHGTMKGGKMKEEGPKGFVTYFSTDKGYADTFGFPVNREVYMAKIDVKKPYKAHAPIADVPKEVHDSDEYVNPRIVKLTNKNYDSVIGKDAGQDQGDTIAVFEPEQIHILGSKKDIEGFRKFVNGKGLNESDYRMQHKAVKNTTADDLEGGGTGFEWKSVKQDHNLTDPATKQSAAILFQLKGKPEKEVTIYRAVPNEVNEINAGDWVTLSRIYAKEYTLDKDTPKLLSKKVKVSDLGWDGADLNEFGYFPGGKTK